MLGAKQAPNIGNANFGVEVHRNMETGLKGADVVMMLRLQLERMTGAFVPVDGGLMSSFGVPG